MRVELRNYANGFTILWTETKRNQRRNRRFTCQTDWDYPFFANILGLDFPRCRCGSSDGTVDCKNCGFTASEMISSASEALSKRIGFGQARIGTLIMLDQLSDVAEIQMTAPEWKNSYSDEAYDAERAWHS